MKLGAPAFFLNSNTLTAPVGRRGVRDGSLESYCILPRETLATGGFLPSWGWVSACQPHMSYLVVGHLDKVTSQSESKRGGKPL